MGGLAGDVVDRDLGRIGLDQEPVGGNRTNRRGGPPAQGGRVDVVLHDPEPEGHVQTELHERSCLGGPAREGVNEPSGRGNPVFAEGLEHLLVRANAVQHDGSVVFAGDGQLGAEHLDLALHGGLRRPCGFRARTVQAQLTQGIDVGLGQGVHQRVQQIAPVVSRICDEPGMQPEGHVSAGLAGNRSQPIPVGRIGTGHAESRHIRIPRALEGAVGGVLEVEVAVGVVCHRADLSGGALTLRLCIAIGLVSLVQSGCGRCGRVSDLPAADVLYVGDSLLAWNEGTCRSVPAETAVQRGFGYTNIAVNGAQMLGGDAPIPDQRPDERPEAGAPSFSVVVIDGGANDLNRRCDCGPCVDTLDALLDEPDDASDPWTGAFVDTTTHWQSTGADVLLLGYHPVKDRAWYGFDGCFDTITELDRRVAAYAEATDGVGFFDVGDVITPDSKGAYAFDGVHFSPKGARLLAPPMAEAIEGL